MPGITAISANLLELSWTSSSSSLRSVSLPDVLELTKDSFIYEGFLFFSITISDGSLISLILLLSSKSSKLINESDPFN